MGTNLTHGERKIYAQLVGEESTEMLHPLSPVEAAIYTVLLTRRYAGPKATVARIVRYFKPGTKDDDIAAAIDAMVARKLLDSANGEVSLGDNWDESLSQATTPRGGFSEQFLDDVDQVRRWTEDELVERVGRAGEARASQRMRIRISAATSRIRLGCFSSTVLFNDVGDAILRACANAHRMELQILMFSPALGIALEGEPSVEADIQRGLNDFRDLFTRIVTEAAASTRRPVCALRWLTDANFAGVHRMLLIDDCAWMFNVHRVGVDRGVDGLVFQGESRREAPTTMYKMADFYWTAAWESAEPKLLIGADREDA
jgi:hypothetical protein